MGAVTVILIVPCCLCSLLGVIFFKGGGGRRWLCLLYRYYCISAPDLKEVRTLVVDY